MCVSTYYSKLTVLVDLTAKSLTGRKPACEVKSNQIKTFNVSYLYLYKLINYNYWSVIVYEALNVIITHNYSIIETLFRFYQKITNRLFTRPVMTSCALRGRCCSVKDTCSYKWWLLLFPSCETQHVSAKVYKCVCCLLNCCWWHVDSSWSFHPQRFIHNIMKEDATTLLLNSTQSLHPSEDGWRCLFSGWADVSALDCVSY